MKKHRPSLRRRQGQALVEFALISPLILFLCFIAFYMGAAMYAGSQASSAIKQPVLNKRVLADTPGDATGIAQGMVTGFSDGNFLGVPGGPVDGGVAVINNGPNNVTALMQASKTFTPPLTFLPPITFGVSQGINSSLLRANPGPTSYLDMFNSGIQVPPYSKSATRMDGTVDPRRYGIAPDKVPQRIKMISDDCGTTGVDVASINTRLNTVNPQWADYQLMSFWGSHPTQNPPVGAIENNYNGNIMMPYSDFEQAFINSGAVAPCETSETATLWQEQCLIEQLAGVIPPIPNYTPGVTGTGNPAGPKFLESCFAKKKYACALQYASKYLNEVRNTVYSSNGCQVQRAMNLPQFKQSSQYAY